MGFFPSLYLLAARCCYIKRLSTETLPWNIKAVLDRTRQYVNIVGAVENDDYEVVQIMYTNYAPINNKALQKAAWKGNLSMVKYFAEHTTYIHNAHEQPLFNAIWEGH